MSDSKFPDERVVIFPGPHGRLEENLHRRIRISYICGVPIVHNMDWMQDDYDPNNENWKTIICCPCNERDKERHLIRNKFSKKTIDPNQPIDDFCCSISVFCFGCLGYCLWRHLYTDHKALKNLDEAYGPIRSPQELSMV